MAKWTIENTTLVNIADAIREKLGTSDNIQVNDLALAVSDIPTVSKTSYQTTQEWEKSLVNSNQTLYDISEDETDIFAAMSNGAVFFISKANRNNIVRREPCPTKADATDLPADMSDFYNDGNNYYVRNGVANDTHWIISIRYSAGAQRDGEHLYGGVAFINKSTKEVEKTYWLPYIVSRVKYDDGILAVGLQMGGIGFYSVSGTTMTELEIFEYDQSSIESPTKSFDSQNGCFYANSDNGHKYYFNAGFSNGFVIYDVTDKNNITEAARYRFKDIPAISSLGGAHTYTSIVKYPYAYLSLARNDKTAKHSEIDGVLTLDISDLNNITLLQHEHITLADAEIFNGGGDTKPTEMRMSQNLLVLNYEYGYLVFELDGTGKKTHYIGRYVPSEKVYAVCGRDNGNIFISENTKTTIKEFSIISDYQ